VRHLSKFSSQLGLIILNRHWYYGKPEALNHQFEDAIWYIIGDGLWSLWHWFSHISVLLVSGIGCMKRPSLRRGSVVWGAENCCFPWRDSCSELLGRQKHLLMGNMIYYTHYITSIKIYRHFWNLISFYFGIPHFWGLLQDKSSCIIWFWGCLFLDKSWEIQYIYIIHPDCSKVW